MASGSVVEQWVSLLRFSPWKLTVGFEPSPAPVVGGSSSSSIRRKLYGELENKEQAFVWLNTAYQERDVGLLGLKNTVPLNSMHSDPRFSELVHRVGLP